MARLMLIAGTLVGVTACGPYGEDPGFPDLWDASVPWNGNLLVLRSPRDLIAIITALEEGGLLIAELERM